MLKRFILVLAIVFVALMLYMAFIKIRSLDYSDGGPALTVRWEGFYHDYNFRDVGKSLNECLGRTVFQPDLLTRSAGWFSGWSCDGIGNPNIIFSLNYAPEKKERFFCQGRKDKNISQFHNPRTKLSDLEFVKTWNNDRMRKPACRFMEEILEALAEEKKILVHCDAGRDRTGTISALVAAMAAEEKNLLTPSMLEAIECDYRKTKSLSRQKHGRMKRFIKTLQAGGGIGYFLQRQCNLDPQLISDASKTLIH